MPTRIRNVYKPISCELFWEFTLSIKSIPLTIVYEEYQRARGQNIER